MSLTPRLVEVKIRGMENRGEKVEKTKFSLIWLGRKIWGENGWSWIFTQAYQISSLQIRGKTREKWERIVNDDFFPCLLLQHLFLFLLSFFFHWLCSFFLVICLLLFIDFIAPLFWWRRFFSLYIFPFFFFFFLFF